MVRRIEGGFFITLEGGEAAGKSTQARRLAEGLRAQEYDVLLTREPGGSPGAEAIRNLLLQDRVALSWRAEILSFVAARCDHLDTVIVPALQRGCIVLCDRFHDSMLAYQGFGVGHRDEQRLKFIDAARSMAACEPHLTFLLNLPRDVARQRLEKRGGPGDRYEDQVEAFHERVCEGFATIARADPSRVKPKNAALPLNALTESLLADIALAIASRMTAKNSVAAHA